MNPSTFPLAYFGLGFGNDFNGFTSGNLIAFDRRLSRRLLRRRRLFRRRRRLG